MLTEQIEAMWISRYDYQPGWYFNKHHHSYFQIIYIISGSGSFYYQDIEKQLAKNKLFLIELLVNIRVSPPVNIEMSIYWLLEKISTWQMILLIKIDSKNKSSFVIRSMPRKSGYTFFCFKQLKLNSRQNIYKSD